MCYHTQLLWLSRDYLEGNSETNEDGLDEEMSHE
jgi:hypothetical protein